MNNHDMTTNTSLASGFGLAVIGTTCCALPIILVTVGMGSVVASAVSALPWLGWLSQYKGITFGVTTLVLAYSWWRLRSGAKLGECSINEGKRLRWQRRVLGISTAIFLAAVFAAYALLPITLWFDV
ncbi:MAG: hypothetical protein CMN84_01285 [Spongiibacteraceae bacterium]|nr:hypothetical protein [Spongiibacteraceae bacterium]